jgi:hypothetical protein
MQESIEQRMFEGIRDWQQSGLTQKAWCEKSNIRYATFHYWYKRYRREGVVAEHHVDNGFVRVIVDSSKMDPWCELAMADGKRLIFHAPVSVEYLRSLIG